MLTNTFGRRTLTVTGLALVLSCFGGCAIVNHLLYVVRGATIPAAYDGLVGKRVAVVCVSPNDDYGPGSNAVMLSRQVEGLLRARVKDIKVVPHSEVANWIDRNNWQYDYLQIGRGVKADCVLAIDLMRFSLHEGSTLYKGHADAEISVFDMSLNGSKVYHTVLEDFTFPARGAQPVTDISESKFKRAFIRVLAENIVRNFHEYDIQEDVASDRATLGN